MAFCPLRCDDLPRTAHDDVAGHSTARLTTGCGHRVGRALAALRSHGSPAVPSLAVRGGQDFPTGT